MISHAIIKRKIHVPINQPWYQRQQRCVENQKEFDEYVKKNDVAIGDFIQHVSSSGYANLHLVIALELRYDHLKWWGQDTQPEYIETQRVYPFLKDQWNHLPPPPGLAYRTWESMQRHIKLTDEDLKKLFTEDAKLYHRLQEWSETYKLGIKVRNPFGEPT